MPSVLVTGAGRGIGRAIALRLAGAGWAVHAGVRRREDGAALATEDARIHPIELDITDAEQVASLADRLPHDIDALVNNAGVVVASPVEATSPEELRRQLEVNVVAQLAVTQALLPRLRATRGRIVFISSVSGRVPLPGMGPYTASKYALEGLVDTLRMELRPWRIRTSLVEPGSIDTDLWRQAPQTIAATEAALAPEHRTLYAKHIKGAQRVARLVQRNTGSADTVAIAVERALGARRPRARYVVGLDARAQLALRAALPTRALDLIGARAGGVPLRAPRG